MAKYTGVILTNKGKELLARAILGEAIVFTKVEIGQGVLSPGTDKEALTSLVNSFKSLSITSTTNLPHGGYRIRISFNNKGFIQDKYLREVGVYARGEDGIEILYSYCNTDTPNLIPNESSGIIESVEDIITYISNAATINAVIDQSNVYATIKDLVEGLATKEDKFNKNDAFNKKFGTSSGTIVQGNDSRIVNAVPNTRKVNGKVLSADITLSAEDIGVVYRWTSMIDKVNYKTICGVTGGRLGAIFDLVVKTTSGGEVVLTRYKIKVNHHHQVHIVSDCGGYSAVMLRLYNDGYEKSYIQIKRIASMYAGLNEVEFILTPRSDESVSIFKDGFQIPSNYNNMVEHKSILSSVNYATGLYCNNNPVAVHGIGDYWITESIANPATKWPGTTWAKLEGRVLLGTSSGYALGSQGGSSTHTLTLEEMVRHRHLVDSHIHTKDIHNHYVNGQNLVLGRAGRDGTFDARSSIALSNDASYYPMDGAGGENTGPAAPYTNYQGSGSAFNIMNPYRAVNIWRRTA